MAQIAIGILIFAIGMFAMSIIIAATDERCSCNASAELLEEIEKKHYELMKKMRIDKYC